MVVGPASCDAACEQRLFLQRQLREMLGRERDRVDKVWLITDDATPKPELRQALAAAPPVPVLRRAARGGRRPGCSRPPATRLEDHLYLVDPMGEWMMRMPAAPDPSRVKRDLERLLRASASWDTAGSVTSR